MKTALASGEDAGGFVPDLSSSNLDIVESDPADQAYGLFNLIVRKSRRNLEEFVWFFHAHTQHQQSAIRHHTLNFDQIELLVRPQLVVVDGENFRKTPIFIG